MKVQVLLQLCEWQLLNPEKFRERVGAKESDEVTWVWMEINLFIRYILIYN